MSKKRLIKSTGAIGIATAISRVLGFIRDIVIANFFGTAIYAQAFVVAFRIPNLLRDLVGEGAANAAFVPVLTSELTKEGKEQFFKLAQVILNILFWTLLLLTFMGILLSPVIVRVIAPGFSADIEKFQITVTLTRILFPFLILVGLWAYAMGVLNSLGHFAVPAFGPCVLNLAIIACAAWFGENVFGLTSGVLVGGALQLFMQAGPLYMHGWRFRLTKEFRHPQAKRIGILLIPRALGACVYQVNVFVSTILASFSGIVGEGAVAALYFANRVWQLPLAIFGIALAQAALPTMSRQVAANDMEKLKETILFSLGILFFILIPASIGLMMLASPITKILFERGAFTAYSTEITSAALFFYAIGLVACGGVKVLVSAFYSMHDTMTPVKTAVWSLIINIILSVIFMAPFKVGGLAFATSISAAFNFIILYVMLKKRLGGLDVKETLDSFLRTLVAAAVMALYLKIFFSGAVGLKGLILAICTAIMVFIASSYVLKVKEMAGLLSWITRKQ